MANDENSERCERKILLTAINSAREARTLEGLVPHIKSAVDTGIEVTGLIKYNLGGFVLGEDGSPLSVEYTFLKKTVKKDFGRGYKDEEEAYKRGIEELDDILGENCLLEVISTSGKTQEVRIRLREPGE